MEKQRWFFSQLFRNYETWIYRSFWLAPAPLEASDKPGISWMSGAWNELLILLNIWFGNWYVFLWALRSGLEAEQEILEKVHHWHTKHLIFFERFRFFVLNGAGLSYWECAPTWNMQICRVILETNGVGGVAVISAEASFNEKTSWI